MFIHFYIFFFQAEDGIRDFHVTGVQTCALPISGVAVLAHGQCDQPRRGDPLSEIGRASCRERVESSVVAVSLKKKRGEGRGATNSAWGLWVRICCRWSARSWW